MLLLRPVGQTRVNVPFSPYFLHEVAGNHVLSISSKGDTVDGMLKAIARVPSAGYTAISTRLFSTQVPTFADNNQLSQLLEAHAVRINATSTESSTPLGVSLLLGFGPILLLVGCLCCSRVGPRRAAVGWERWVRSVARRPDGSIRRRSG